MGRLVPEALYSNEMVEEHYLRDIRMGERSFDEVINPDARWETLADRVRQIDPFGLRSRELLMLVEAKP